MASFKFRILGKQRYTYRFLISREVKLHNHICFNLSYFCFFFRHRKIN
ncbi:unnamed protein product [Callosobruchus maculatus]|uniref:Uncharacterized protein n=1 Tax=Callosobruchus maculatus TaxID=64391 RepID=A0A653CGJ2_CALMS|nr:unnamed protein product [Callosobruchus maculatus]